MQTIIGMGWGWFCIIYSIYWASGFDVQGIYLFFDIPSIFITCGGTLAAMLIAHPTGDFKNAPAAFMKSISYKLDNPVELIQKLVRYAELARKNGILALDGATDPTDDAFMSKGIQLAVDGIDPDAIKDTMTTELTYTQNRHVGSRSFFNNICKYAPCYGMIGTLIGLVIMLKNLSDPSLIGPNMAVALITTFYGAMMANFVAIPCYDRLGIKEGDETMNKEIIIAGVLAIQSGDNPRMVEQKLKVYLSPKDRGADAEAA